jgi:hypothetical protein
MSFHRLHILEKLQVQLTALLGAIAVYLLFSAARTGADPMFPAAFLATGNVTGLGVAILVLIAAGAAAGVLTVSSRPEGSIAAALLAAGGICLHSAPMRTLLMYRPDSMASLYAGLLAELLVLWLAGLLAAGAALATRSIASALAGRLGWRSPGETIDEQARQDLQERMQGESRYGLYARDGGKSLFAERPLAALWRMIDPARTSEGRVAEARQIRRIRARTAMCLGASAVLSLIFLGLFLRSDQRGQVLFALAAGSCLGVLIAHQILPAPLGPLTLLLPVVLGLPGCVLGLLSASASAEGPNAWMAVGLWSRALPVDWVCGTGGGAMFGLWLSGRIHAQRLIEKVLQQREGESPAS